jgi:hypothetical protein
LASSVQPLPIELLDWSGACESGAVRLSWTTASEQDNAYFSIEKSADAAQWWELGRVDGAGNSQAQVHYTYLDPEASELAYYRLRQTDFNGSSKVSDAIAAGCGMTTGTHIVNAWDDGAYLNVVVSATTDGRFDLSLLDAQGKILAGRPAQPVSAGITSLQLAKQGIATGIYVVRMANNATTMVRRVYLR